MSTAVGEGASWFSHSGGVKSIAQAGSQTIQANTDALEILADQSITVTSSNDEIHILAKEKIVLHAGQSSVTLEGQNITFACPGKFSVKGSGNAFMGPGSSPAETEVLPEGGVHPTALGAFTETTTPHDEQFVLIDQNRNPVPNFMYQALLADGKIIYGITNEKGETKRIPTGNIPMKISFQKDARGEHGG